MVQAERASKPSTDGVVHLSDHEFQQFRKFIHDVAGISLSDAKKPLVMGRLSKRLKQLDLPSFSAYFRQINQDMEERQIAVNLLTTNETYFFREPKHFEFLRHQILPKLKGKAKIRIWCGACSSGEEPYTLGMVLADTLGHFNWEIVASDISTRVLETARQGLYRMEDAEGIPKHLLHRYCLKGVGAMSGTFLMDAPIRNRIDFRQINLKEPLPPLGEFDVIFLRNVMIYFDMPTKQKILQKMIPLLASGGYFMVSHSESLNGITDALKPAQPSIYVKPETFRR